MRFQGAKSVVFIAVMFAASSLTAGVKYKVVGGPDDFYFGHISYVEIGDRGESPLILRDGAGAPEPAVVNAPLGPGDTVRTPDDLRCEIQFDTGTIVRLDAGTELRIETVNARSLSSSKGLTNIVLSGGLLYIMYKEYDSREVFQVLTPTAAVKFDHRTVGLIKASADGVTDIQVKAGKASALFGRSADDRREKAVRKLERLIVLGDGQFQISGYIADTGFEKWNDAVNADFENLHKGTSALPKPLQTLPEAVVYFAQKYGSLYGEWVWDSFLGYVWRPYVRQIAPGGDWQPYASGHWTSAANQLFWIPDEPWGWVPYHLGIWHWDKKLGWVWLPGSLFASAWTEWDFLFGYYSWRPWGFMDWYGLEHEYYYGLLSPYFFASAGIWPPGNGRAGYDTDWWNTASPRKPLVSRITKDQLKKGEVHSLPMPREIKSAYKNFVAAFRRNDGRAVDSLKFLAEKSVFVKPSDVRSPRLGDKILAASQISPGEAGPGTSGPARNPHREVLWTFNIAGALESSSPIPARPGPARFPGGGGIGRLNEGPRFRDWNPDIRVARRLGVNIDYSSRRNVVRCPELRLTSGDRSHFGTRLSPFGVWSPFGGGIYSGGASGTPGAGGNNAVVPPAPAHQGGHGSGDRGGGGGDAAKK